jgi:hypothetical protein
MKGTYDREARVRKVDGELLVTHFEDSWMAVLLPMKVAEILRPRGGMSQTAVLMLLGSVGE